MRTAVIACEMTRAELTRVLTQEALPYPVFWIEPALHNVPRKLHSYLQALMDDHAAEFDRYLVAMGQCGNATEQLHTGDYQVILPRVDDCITTLLGSLERRRAISREKITFFLTQSWLKTDSENLITGYEYALSKYGPRRGKLIYRELLKHYKQLGLLDTGCYDPDALKEQVSGFAEEYGLGIQTLPATDDYLRQLLTGPWPEDRFSVTPPHSWVHISL